MPITPLFPWCGIITSNFLLKSKNGRVWSDRSNSFFSNKFLPSTFCCFMRPIVINLHIEDIIAMYEYYCRNINRRLSMATWSHEEPYFEAFYSSLFTQAERSLSFPSFFTNVTSIISISLDYSWFDPGRLHTWHLSVSPLVPIVDLYTETRRWITYTNKKNFATTTTTRQYIYIYTITH